MFLGGPVNFVLSSDTSNQRRLSEMPSRAMTINDDEISTTTKNKGSTRPTSKQTSTMNEPLQREVLDEPELNSNPIIGKDDLIQRQYELQMKRKKYEQQQLEKKFKRTLIRLSNQEHILCLVVDGYEISKESYEIVINEFLPRIKNSVLIACYIYNNIHDEEYNWRHQKQYIIEYYKTRLTTSLSDDKGYLIIQDKNPNCVHEVEQIYKIAQRNNFEYFIIGYNALKGPTLKPRNIPKGLDYLLSESRVPTFIMKDKLLRGQKNKGYKWLLIMDRSSSDCFKVFDHFLPFMDIEKDFIYGLTLIPPYVNFDDIKRQFYERLKEVGFDEEEQCGYESQQYTTRYASFVREFVNHSTLHYFDFVLFYNNPDKYKIQRTESESLKLLEYINANIGFVNGAYLDKFNPDNYMEIAEKIENNEEDDFNPYDEEIAEIENKNGEKDEEKEENKEEKLEEKLEENFEEKLEEKKEDDKENDKEDDKVEEKKSEIIEDEDKSEAIDQEIKINDDNKTKNTKKTINKQPLKPVIKGNKNSIPLKTNVQSNKPGSKQGSRSTNAQSNLQKPISTGRPRPQVQYPIVKK